VLRFSEFDDQGHGPLGDGRTLATWWSTAPVPRASDAPVLPTKVPAEPAEYLSIATAAQYVDCSEGLIRKFLKAPDPLPSITLGRARRIPRLALDAWIARRMAAPGGVDDVLAAIRARPR
jgi:excisionase family DNA binding protein